MSFPANFYTISKRDNSTKQPTGSGTTINIRLKDECGIVNPSIILTGVSNPTSYNMVYIDAFSRYYHINNWTYDRGEWIADCTVDVLASYKTQISGSTKYVERAASSGAWDGDIIDGYYPAKVGYSLQYQEGTPAWGTESLVVGIINDQNFSEGGAATTFGAVSYYLFTAAQAKAFFAWLFGAPDIASYINAVMQGWTAVLAQWIQAACLAAWNPMQYVVSAKWLPFTPSIGTPVSTIKVGTVSVALPATLLRQDGVQYSKAGSFTIPKHPLAATRGAYLNGAPYTRYSLLFEPFGHFAIDSNELKSATTVNYELYADVVTGNASLLVKAYNGNALAAKIGEYYSNVAADIPLAQISRDYITPVLNAASGVQGALTSGNPLALAGSVVDAVTSVFPHLSLRGQGGSILVTMEDNPTLLCYTLDIAGANDADAGRPVCKDLTLGTLSGFIKCADGDIEISGTQGEREELARFLTSGFYLE